MRKVYIHLYYQIRYENEKAVFYFIFSDVLCAFTYDPEVSDGTTYSNFNPKRGKNSGTFHLTPHASPIIIPHENLKTLCTILPQMEASLMNDM